MAGLIVDVSSNNGNVSVGAFRTLKRHGVVGCYVKATESTGYTNPLLHSQWSNASQAGLRCGVYHFARQDLHPSITARGRELALPVGDGVMGVGLRAQEAGARLESVVKAEIDPHLSIAGAKLEARHFVAAMRTIPGHHAQAMLRGDLRPVLDFEIGTSDHHYSQWLDAFQREVYRLTKRRTILYTYTAFNAWAPPLNGFGQLWLANYSSRPTLPGGYGAFDLWQYTDGAVLGGIRIDASRFPRRVFPMRRITCKGKGT